MKVVSELNAKPKVKTVREKPYYKEPLLAALLTLVCFVFLNMLGMNYPFGNIVSIASDLEAQYAPFLFMFKNWLVGITGGHFINNISYINQLGMGKNIFGTFAYYLASPLNLLVFLFQPEQVSLFISTLMAIKLMFASAFMTLFIHERAEEKESKIPVLFGVIYAFTSYSMFFLINIMWLDGYAILPLLLYLLEKRLKGKKNTLSISITLIVLFIANYYIAYMVGIMSFIYLLIRIFEEKKSYKLAVNYAVNAVFSALAAAVVLVPAALDTLRSQYETSETHENLFKFEITDFLRLFYKGDDGDFGDIMIANKPFLFISLLFTCLIAIYFLSPVYKGITRKIHGICFILVIASLGFVWFDVAWQAFDFPNWFWHRETFVFYPLLFIIALRAMERIKEVSKEDFLKSSGILIAIPVALRVLGKESFTDKQLLFNILFICLFMLLLYALQIKKWPEQLVNMPKLVPFLLALVAVVETSALTSMMSSSISGVLVSSDINSEYISNIYTFEDFAYASSIVDNGYRAENEQRAPDIVTDGPSQVGSFYTGYKGISFFNSNSNKKAHEFLSMLGYMTNYNYFAVSYNYMAPATDAFFSIGTVYSYCDYSAARYVANDDYNLGRQFYINDNVLPLGFEVASGAVDFDYYRLKNDYGYNNYFEFQNDWYESMFPDNFGDGFWVSAFEDVQPEIINGMAYDKAYYHYGLEDQPEEFRSNRTLFGNSDTSDEAADSKKKDENSISLYRMNEEMPIIISYKMTVDSSDELYINVSGNDLLNEGTVYINGQEVGNWSEKSFHPLIMRLGSFEIGEEIQVDVLCVKNVFTYTEINFAYFDKAAFDSQFTGVDTDSVVLKDCSNGYFLFDANVDEGNMVLTTIPYEDGWTLKVDGQKKDITVYHDGLIAIDTGAGNHTIELEFVSPGLKIGGICTIIGIIGIVLIAIVDKKTKTTQIAKKIEPKV